MIKFIQRFIITVVALYLLLLILSPQMANFVMSIFLVLSIPVLILRHIFMDRLYKYSINIVSKQYIIGNNAISNEHCTIKYTPDDKIVVVDNFVTKNHGKRMFTLKKGDISINKAWNRLCRVYDSFITLDSLAAFFSYDTKVDIITLETKLKPEEKTKQIQIDASNQGPKFVEMSAIQADPYSKGLETPNDKGAQFVEFDSIKEQEQYVQSKQNVPDFVEFGSMKEQEQYVQPKQNTPDFVELQDVLSSGNNKIDVNTATSSEISILPGINIVKAKKIIEYRDKNGLFKSVDEFIAVAELKQHFVEKIKPMIVAGKPVEEKDNDDYSEGRIVDL